MTNKLFIKESQTQFRQKYGYKKPSLIIIFTHSLDNNFIKECQIENVLFFSILTRKNEYPIMSKNDNVIDVSSFNIKQNFILIRTLMKFFNNILNYITIL